MIRWAIYPAMYHLRIDAKDATHFNITAQTRVNDVASGDPIYLQMESFVVGPQDREMEVVRMAAQILHRFEQHEMDEHFFFNGKKVFDPHAPKPLK